MKYQYITYDVWGNEVDGFEVNQAFTTGEFVELENDITDKQIIESLIKQDFINQDVDINKIEIDGELEYSLYFEYEGKPEFELRAEG